MQNMMLVSARLLSQYRPRFPPGDNGESVCRDWSDQFTSNLGRLRLIFEVRDQERRDAKPLVARERS